MSAFSRIRGHPKLFAHDRTAPVLDPTSMIA
jgi:hypothetical protein